MNSVNIVKGRTTFEAKIALKLVADYPPCNADIKLREDNAERSAIGAATG
jgi:hypothetical protein